MSETECHEISVQLVEEDQELAMEYLKAYDAKELHPERFRVFRGVKAEWERKHPAPAGTQWGVASIGPHLLDYEDTWGA